MYAYMYMIFTTASTLLYSPISFVAPLPLFTFTYPCNL